MNGNEHATQYLISTST